MLKKNEIKNGGGKKRKNRLLYKGFWDAFKRIGREEGIKGLYRGLGPALLLTSHGAIQVLVLCVI